MICRCRVVVVVDALNKTSNDYGMKINIKKIKVIMYKNLAIANRSRVSCAHNTLRSFIGTNITP